MTLGLKELKTLAKIKLWGCYISIYELSEMYTQMYFKFDNFMSNMSEYNLFSSVKLDIL